MSELFDFSKTIQGYIKEKKYDEALLFYKDNYKKFNKEDISKNEYIVSDIIRCLRKVNKLKGAKKYLDSLGINIDGNTPKRILENYGWVLYDKLKVNVDDHHQNNEDEDVITGLADEHYEEADHIFVEDNPLQEEIKIILPILDFISQYSPFSKLFSATLKKEKKKQNPNWQFVNDLLESISVEKLNTKCEVIDVNIKGRIKTIELASDKESWYAYKSKALLKLGRFQECYDLSQTALNTFDKFHYSNNVWFARRIALCKKELGDVDTAIEELLIILKKKNEWFIQAELCDLYLTKKNYPEAFKYGVLAATNFGDTEYKIGLFLQMGNLLEAMNEIERAYEHYLLVKLIREEQGWKITQALKDFLSKTKNGYKNEFKDSSSLLKHLQDYWKSVLPRVSSVDRKDNKNLYGFISNLPFDKNFGFIKGDNKIDYHFYKDNLQGDQTRYLKGVKVIFDSKPPKIEGKNPSAINIRLKE
jgi:tetratricopeptide (TPR) repeat protein